MQIFGVYGTCVERKTTKQFRFKELAGYNTGIDQTGELPVDPEVIAGLQAMEKGRLIAWDPIAQREVWRAEHPGPWNGGTLATAGDVVFQGTIDGKFKAFNAENGNELWQFDAQTGVSAGPISYAIDGEQYVAVMAGHGGIFGTLIPNFDGPKAHPNGRLLVFKLGGTLSLPDFDRNYSKPFASDTSTESAGITAHTKGEIEEGRILYETYCAGCHAVGTLSSGVIPDLKRSAFATSKEAWAAVLLEGALESRGMVSFSNLLSAEQAESIRGYIVSAAHRAAAK